MRQASVVVQPLVTVLFHFLFGFYAVDEDCICVRYVCVVVAPECCDPMVQCTGFACAGLTHPKPSQATLNCSTTICSNPDVCVFVCCFLCDYFRCAYPAWRS